MDWVKFWNEVYVANQKLERPCAFIQWKGTDACMDCYCTCGEQGHIDSDFAYYYECHACGKRYAMAMYVKMIPLNEEQAAYAEGRHAFLKDTD